MQSDNWGGMGQFLTLRWSTGRPTSEEGTTLVPGASAAATRQAAPLFR
jgi:hypothetical protein